MEYRFIFFFYIFWSNFLPSFFRQLYFWLTSAKHQSPKHIRMVALPIYQRHSSQTSLRGRATHRLESFKKKISKSKLLVTFSPEVRIMQLKVNCRHKVNCRLTCPSAELADQPKFFPTIHFQLQFISTLSGLKTLRWLFKKVCLFSCEALSAQVHGSRKKTCSFVFSIRVQC